MASKSTLLAGEVASLTVKSHKELTGILQGIRETVTGGENPGRPMWVLRFSEGTFNVLESTDMSKCKGSTVTVGASYHCVWDGPRSTVEPVDFATGEVNIGVEDI